MKALKFMPGFASLKRYINVQNQYFQIILLFLLFLVTKILKYFFLAYQVIDHIHQTH